MQIPVLPGDGIGPEITAVTVPVLERLDRRFDLGLRFDVHEVGAGSLKPSGSTLPQPVVAACRAAEGSAPDIAGQDIANPCALLISAGMLLGWLGEKHGADRFRHAQAALASLVREPATRTRDLGGTLGTRAFGAALLEKLG
ncbi:MAG: isocitrate/isopropylmalate family dehydrogenase [Burkholderiales bacterium]